MIVTNLSPLGISWNVAIHNSPFSLNKVNRVSLLFGENQHDIAYVDVLGVPLSYLSNYVGKPLTITISVRGDKQCSFYGYVSHIEGSSTTNLGTSNNVPFQTLRIVCMGSSNVLRDVRNQVWENVTLENVVEEIASQHRLGYSVPKDDYVFKRLIQSEESSWQLLVKACRQLSYELTLTNSHIHVWNKSKSPARQPSYSVLQGTISQQKDYTPRPGNIIKFDAVLGTPNVVEQSGNKEISYIDEKGTVVSVTSLQTNGDASFGTAIPSDFNNQLSINVDSFEKATRYLKAKMDEAKPYIAEALVYGEPSIRPGGLVRIEGYGGDFNGYWYVHAVSHELFSESLTTVVKLSKDGSIDALPKFPVVQRYVEAPLPILINNKWSMRSQYVNVYN